jgi:hypothetical protein
MNEIYKDIKGYEGWYQISNLGNVKRIMPGVRTYVGRIMKSSIDANGYYSVQLFRGKPDTREIHRLVGQAFIPNSENKAEINHINGVKTDNQIKNLEWVTRPQNMQHAFKTGLKTNEGEHNPKAKLSEANVLDIRNKYATGHYSQAKLAREHNVCRQQIWGIVHNKSWTHI